MSFIFLLGCRDEEGLKELQDIRDKPDYEEGCAIFDFEKGELTNWTMTGSAFKYQPTYGDNIFYREKKKMTGFSGNWWISSYEYHPSPTSERSVTSLRDTGTLESPEFHINVSKISFLIGGGDGTKRIRVELLVFGKVVNKLILGGTIRKMERTEFDVSKNYRKPARIRLVDNSPTGSLMFDDLRTVEICNDSKCYLLQQKKL